MTSSLHEPRYWEFRAEEVRTLSADIKDARAKEIMMRIGNEYLQLAEVVRAPPRPDER